MERIRLYNNIDDKKDRLESSWIWDISWNGSLVIRRYEDVEKDGTTVRQITPMKYDVSRELFEEIKNSRSKGSAINRLIIQNKDVNKAEVSESTKEFEI